MADAVLVPFDESPLSLRALRHAFDRFPNADVIVYYVIDVFDPSRMAGADSTSDPLVGSTEWHAMEREAAEQLLAEAEAVAEEYDREVETETEVGDPSRLIPDFARDRSVDHVVIGAHGREEEDRQLVGRVAETVVFRSPVPVTVIR